jgi:hypothetical protein
MLSSTMPSPTLTPGPVRYVRYLMPRPLSSAGTAHCTNVAALAGTRFWYVDASNVYLSSRRGCGRGSAFRRGVGADAVRSRSRCGAVPEQIAARSRGRCGAVPWQMWRGPGADVARQRRGRTGRCRPRGSRTCRCRMAGRAAAEPHCSPPSRACRRTSGCACTLQPPVLVQMWEGGAQFRCRHGSG